MRSIRTFPYEYQLSLREKVIAYPVDWCPGRKAYSKLHTFLKRPVEIWDVFCVAKIKKNIFQKTIDKLTQKG